MSDGALVRVRGLAELNRAFAKMGADAKRTITAALTKAAEPIGATAAQRAWSEVTNMTERWSRMRVGANTQSVYVVPASRRSRGTPRPNLGDLLMDKAMYPAAVEHEDELELAVGAALDELADLNGF